MSNEHTPSPWNPVRDGCDVCADDAFIVIAYHKVVASAYGQHNARLIAAAPDLLAACELLLASHTADPPDSWPAIIAAQTAIAKAKGEA